MTADGKPSYRQSPHDPRDARFCYCGAERGHYGWQQCDPKPTFDTDPPHDGMTWEELLAHPALTFDPQAEVTVLLLAPSSDLPRRPWLYDANTTGENTGARCRSCGIGEWVCNPVPMGDLDGPVPDCCEDCDHTQDAL